MITIISGTNRPNSRTSLIASHCFQALHDAGEDVQLLDLVDLNLPILSDEMYNASGQHPYISTLQD
ncbi:MAG: NAD(P)H-dependent oxidoreductase, partial [Saprospiraceae bacterium]|nr:NAD(P)H-dependent oxidoreductase [Saprospiraceae bacterium]